MAKKQGQADGSKIVPQLGIALEHGEKLVVAVRPQPGAMFSAAWALPIMLSVLGTWGATSGNDNFTWDWGLYAGAWVLGAGAFLLWRRASIIVTDRRLIQVGFIRGSAQVRWADVATISNHGDIKDRLTGYGPRNNPLFITKRDGTLVKFRQIPKRMGLMDMIKPYLPQAVTTP